MVSMVLSVVKPRKETVSRCFCLLWWNPRKDMVSMVLSVVNPRKEMVSRCFCLLWWNPRKDMHGWKYVRIYMEIRKIEMCIRRSPYFDNFQNKKNKKIKKMFWFRSAIWSDPYTRPLAEPCFLKLTHAHALPEVVKIVVNWRDPCFIHLRSPEQFEKMPCLSEGYELSVAIDKNVKKQMELEVDSGGGRGRSTVLTLGSKVRWAEGCN